LIQISIKFDSITNVNNGYVINQGRRFKNNKSKTFQKTWTDAISPHKDLFKNFNYKTNYFSLTVYWHNPKFFTKDKKLSKQSGDIESFIKFLQDGVFQGIGIDDCTVKRLEIVELPAIEKSHTITINLSMENLNSLINFKI
jgi:hypothetical protein